MNDYIREMAASLVVCAVIALPPYLVVDPIDGITFETHELDIVEYRDAEGAVLARHTVLA